MPHTPEEYRRAASDTRKLAARVTDSWQRLELLDIAAKWEKLAKYLASQEANETDDNSN